MASHLQARPWSPRSSRQAGCAEPENPPQGGFSFVDMQDLRPMNFQTLSPTVPTDTIIAIATAVGAGGVGIVRLSGPSAIAIAGEICGQAMQPRQAHYVHFRNELGEVIDDGLVLSFPGPRSFTGEDVVCLLYTSRCV